MPPQNSRVDEPSTCRSLRRSEQDVRSQSEMKSLVLAKGRACSLATMKTNAGTSRFGHAASSRGDDSSRAPSQIKRRTFAGRWMAAVRGAALATTGQIHSAVASVIVIGRNPRRCINSDLVNRTTHSIHSTCPFRRCKERIATRPTERDIGWIGVVSQVAGSRTALRPGNLILFASRCAKSPTKHDRGTNSRILPYGNLI